MFEDSDKILKKYVNKIIKICVIFSVALCGISIMCIIGGQEFGITLLLFSIISAISSYVIGAFLCCIADLVEQSKLQTQLLKRNQY